MLLEEVDAFLAEPVPPMKPPVWLIDRFVDLIEAETGADRRIVDALRAGDYVAAACALDRAARRRRHAAGRLELLAADTVAMASRFDGIRDVFGLPAIGPLRGDGWVRYAGCAR